MPNAFFLVETGDDHRDRESAIHEGFLIGDVSRAQDVAGIVRWLTPLSAASPRRAWDRERGLRHAVKSAGSLYYILRCWGARATAAPMPGQSLAFPSGQHAYT